jgi:hypothetical protein
MPADFKKLCLLQQHVTGFHNINNYTFSQTDMLMKSQHNMKARDNENIQVTIMLAALTDGSKLSSPVILINQGLKEQLPTRIIVRRQLRVG